MSDTHGADGLRAKSFDVFVSYKRVDHERRDVLVAALEAAGLEVWWDVKLQSGAWRPQLAERINRAKVVVALWSHQAAAAPDEVADEMAQARGLDRLVALRTDGAEPPARFRDQNFVSFDQWADEVGRAPQLDAIVAEVLRRVDRPTYRVVEAAAAHATTLTAPAEFGDIPGAPPRLVGREAELAMLHGAWNSAPPEKVNAVVLHALGGAGKSALLRTFANNMLAAGGGGAARIYGWSAYSQGSGEQKRADADGFITKALGEFGHQGEISRDPVERARTLAKLIQAERVLLLLDGLEPLQDAPNLNKGRFKDKGLAELIKLLGNANPGLMVLTTRQEVPELKGHGPLVINHALDELSPAAGADLLVELGVTGRQRELEAAVADVDGHALSVTLLGTYLAEVCGGDIRHRDRFDFADIVLSPEEEELADRTIVPAKRAAKIMRGYLEQFEKLAGDKASAGLGGPERALLHLVGLFDRPADGPAVAALLDDHIPGLTDELFFEQVETVSGWLFKSRSVEARALTAEERGARLREAKSRLRKLRLLSGASQDDPRGLDAHPVVRAFFAGRLEESAPEAATAAHEILYQHYGAVGPDLPDTLEEMQPLFHAVRHGVKAGRTQEACDEVFHRRILRESTFYLTRVLGAFSPYLAVIANFFDPPWQAPRRDLRRSDRAWLLGEAAYALTALGRLTDSVAPRRAGLEDYVDSENWRQASINGGNSAATLLTLGRVSEAVAVAETAVAHADRSEHDDQREFRRADLADALTAAGELDRAAGLFGDAEAISQKTDTDTPLLYSLRGYQYGDLILSRGDADDALARGRYQLDLAERYLGQGMGLNDIGLAHLLVGRAQDSLGDPNADASLDAAVEGLRKAGMSQYLPRALLARAAHRRRRAGAGEAGLVGVIHADLDEIDDVAGEEMQLHLTDLALERARLALDVPDAVRGPEETAQAQTERAAALIAETGYHRRDGELADLKARLAAAPSGV